MQRLADKLALTALACALAFVPGMPAAEDVALLLLVVALSALRERLERERAATTALALFELGLTLVLPRRLPCALPLVAYDLMRCNQWLVRGLWLLPLGYALYLGTPALEVALAASSAFVASALSLRTGSVLEGVGRMHALRDSLQEKVFALDASRRELMDAQEAQAEAAQLAERARISREIHDSVGHLLTRSILQAQALEVVHASETGVAADFAEVRGTLEEALTVTRRSVYALADEAVDLQTELHRLAEASGIARVRVECLVDAAPPAEISRCAIAVTREALTNAARHGNAREARVRFVEHPALYQLLVANEGNAVQVGGVGAGELQNQLAGKGMGVRGMWDRVTALGGTFRLSVEGGEFAVFASLPKRPSHSS